MRKQIRNMTIDRYRNNDQVETKTATEIRTFYVQYSATRMKRDHRYYIGCTT
jgi:hypothetical protein